MEKRAKYHRSGRHTMSVQFSHIMAGDILPDTTVINGRTGCGCLLLIQGKRNLQPEVAAYFRENILSKGGTEHPMTLYKRFRGQEPSIHALLKRNGIIN